MLYENHPGSRSSHYIPQSKPNNKAEQNAGSFERVLVTRRRVLGDADGPHLREEILPNFDKKTLKTHATHVSKLVHSF